MFMLVNSKCAPQVRPPLSRIRGVGRLSWWYTLADYTGLIPLENWNPSHVRESLGVGALDTVPSARLNTACDTSRYRPSRRRTSVRRRRPQRHAALRQCPTNIDLDLV
jgi:hypothetical protein